MIQGHRFAYSVKCQYGFICAVLLIPLMLLLHRLRLLLALVNRMFFPLIFFPIADPQMNFSAIIALCGMLLLITKCIPLILGEFLVLISH